VDWIAQAKSVSIMEAARRIGALKAGPSNSLGPCPQCGAEKRGSSDRRYPIGVNSGRDGWRCHKCGVSGDVVDLVAYFVAGRRLADCGKSEQLEVVNWFKDVGHVKDNGMPTPKPKKEKQRPPKAEVQKLWLATLQVEECSSSSKFLEDRQFDLEQITQLGFLRAAPRPSQHNWPKWWPKVWAKTYRLVTPAYDVAGNFVSLHARAVAPSEQGKTRWPRGYEAGALFMANRLGVKLLKGQELGEIRGVLICEGMTDLLRASLCAVQSELRLAIIAGTSGSFQHLAQVRFPEDTQIYTAMDPDEGGAKYCAQIRKALSSHQIRPLPLPEN